MAESFSLPLLISKDDSCRTGSGEAKTWSKSAHSWATVEYKFSGLLCTFISVRSRLALSPTGRRSVSAV